MTKPKAPRTTEQATELLARHALIEGKLASVEARRSASHARINKVADLVAGVLQAQLAEIRVVLEPWWQGEGKALLPKGRKSMQLGGCMIGSRTARATLGHGFESDKAAAAKLRETRLANQTTRVSYSIDRAATLKLIEKGGKTAETLTELGFTVQPSSESFFIERAEQAGTIGS